LKEREETGMETGGRHNIEERKGKSKGQVEGGGKGE